MAVRIGCCGFPVAQARYLLNLVHGVYPFKQQAVAGRFRYYRLHGITGYRYRFTEADLRGLKEFCRGAKDTYVLFNNDSMWADARRFQRLLRRDQKAG